MRRILMVCPHGVRGGVARVATALAARLPERGFETVPVLLQRGPLEDMLAATGRPAVVLPRRYDSAREPSGTVRALARLASEHRAEVVLSHGNVGHLYGGLAARRARLPAVWWRHGSPRRSPRRRLIAAIPAAAIVCVSDAAVAAQRDITPRARVSKITPGAPVDELAELAGSGGDIRASRAWAGRPVIGIMARLDPVKGHLDFLEAAAVVAREHPESRFAIVGGRVPGRRGRAHAASIHHATRGLGLERRVHVAGDQPNAHAWLDAFDIMVLPSHREAFPIVLVEAMALGTPVVATALPGPAEIVEDGVSGLLVRPGDVAELAAAITRLLADRELATRVVAGGRARARDLTEEAMVRELATLMEEIVG